MSLTFTIDRGSGPEPLPYGPFTDGAGVSHSVQVLDLWSDAELAALGVVRAEAADVPARVSRLQAKQALLAAELLETVEAAVAGASAEVRVYWAEASHFHRDHPVIEAMRVALGWSAAELDALFVAAAGVS